MPLDFKTKSSFNKKKKFKCKNCGKNMLSPGFRILGFLFYPLLALFFFSDSELSVIALILLGGLGIAMSFAKRPTECPHCGKLDVKDDEVAVQEEKVKDEFDDENSMNPGFNSVVLFIVIAIVFMSIGTGFVYWFINLL